MEHILARTKPCLKCSAESPCALELGCRIQVPLHLIQDFRESHPSAELATNESKEHVIWRYWDAGYERSFHGEPAIVELGEIS